jgi:hypothetical protein
MTVTRGLLRWMAPVLATGVLIGITTMAVWKRAPEQEPLVTCGRFQVVVPGEEDLAGSPSAHAPGLHRVPRRLPR